MKKMIALGLILVLSALSLAGCGKTDSTRPYTIGISQFAEHASLDNCLEGFLLGLEQAGLQENTDYTLRVQNAGGDPALASQIADGFSAGQTDLMVGIATPAAVACYAAAEERNTPVVFTAITDPVGAGLDSGNVTGTSDVLPVEAQLQLIRALQPEADTIGLIYTTSEPNSVYSVGIYEALAEQYGFTMETLGITAQPEVAQAVDTLLRRGVDCLTNITDNTVTGVLASTLEKAREAGIPVYGSEVEQMKLGCVAGAGLDYIQLGIQTGIMSASILRGEIACTDLPFETIEEYQLYLNSPALAEFGLTVPDSIRADAQEAAE